MACFQPHVCITLLKLAHWGMRAAVKQQWGQGGCVGVGDRVKSGNLLWWRSMLTIIDSFWAIRLCSCRTWGGPGRHYLIHLCESEQPMEIKWILIRTVWASGWLYLNQSKGSSGKSTPCFQLLYVFFFLVGDIRSFFFLRSSVWFILMHPTKFISQEEFAPAGISLHSLHTDNQQVLLELWDIGW